MSIASDPDDPRNIVDEEVTRLQAEVERLTREMSTVKASYERACMAGGTAANERDEACAALETCRALLASSPCVHHLYGCASRGDINGLSGPCDCGLGDWIAKRATALRDGETGGT